MHAARLRTLNLQLDADDEELVVRCLRDVVASRPASDVRVRLARRPGEPLIDARIEVIGENPRQPVVADGQGETVAAAMQAARDRLIGLLQRPRSGWPSVA